MRNARTTRRRGVTVGLMASLFALLIAVVVTGCGGGSSSSSGSTSGGGTEESSGGSSGGAKLSVVGYSTPESVYTETLQPAFEKTPQGEGVSFSDSFGAFSDMPVASERLPLAALRCEAVALAGTMGPAPAGRP